MRFLLIILILFLSYSCDYTRVYEENRSIEASIWNSDQEISFPVKIKNNKQGYQLYFNVRNNQDYKYSNLFVLSELTLPNGQKEKDTLEFILCDVTGKWLGKTSGSLVTHQVLFQRNVFFPDTGLYQFNFSQAMRDDELLGITEIGLRVAKNE